MPLKWSDVVAKEGDDRGIALTVQQQYALILLAEQLHDYPALFFSDWKEHDPDEINEFTEDLLTATLTESIPVPTNNMLVTDIFTINGVMSSGLKNYNASTALPFGYSIFSDTGLTGHSLKNFLWLREGEYRYSGWSTLSTNGGICELTINHDTGGALEFTIKSGINQSGAFGTRVNTTDAFFISANGFYNICVRNTGAVSGNRVLNWISHHIYQVE